MEFPKLGYLIFGNSQVVGGAGHGGVLVRSGPTLSDDLCEARLATGAVVKKVEERVSENRGP